MSKFYGRLWSIDLDDKPFIEVTNGRQFKMTFNVIQEFGEAVSYADIALWNLSESTALKAIQKLQTIVLKAGYEDTLGVIFSGRVINILRERQTADVITRLICRAGVQTVDKTVNKALGKDTKLVDIIKECINAMGYKPVINEDDFKNEPLYTKGYTLTGDPRVYMDKLALTHKFNYMVEGDTVLVVGNQSFRKGNPFVVNQFTGMIGIPEITEAGCDVKIKLNPQAKIGGQVDIQSELATFNFSNLYYQDIPPSAGKGIYNVFRVIHTGDSWGDDWATQLTGYRPEYTGSVI